MPKISTYPKHNAKTGEAATYVPVIKENVPGVYSNAIQKITDIVDVAPPRGKVLFDKNRYWNGQVVAKTDDGWLYFYYTDAPSHVTTGDAYLTRTRNGADWEEGWLLNVLGETAVIGAVALGVRGNRLLLSYQHVVDDIPTYDNVYFAYSDDGGKTFIQCDMVPLNTLPAQFDEVFVYGNITKIFEGGAADGSGDVYYLPYYANWAGDPSFSFYYKSTDGGMTWDYGGTIMEGLSAGIFPTGGHVNETWLTVIEKGNSLATTKLMALVRSEKYYTFHYQLYSLDGGATWVNLGVTQGKWFTEANAFDSLGGPDVGSNTYPLSMITRGEYIYVVYGHRGVNGVGNGDHQLRVIKGKALEVYNNPDNWSKPTKLYFAIAPTKAFPNDFGYPYPFELNGRLYATYYDLSISHLSGSSVSATKTRLAIIPLEGHYYFDAYAVADQAIPDATDTTVVIPATRLDSERSLDEDTDITEVPEDGWYNVNGWITFEPSAAGTYRELKLYMIDIGDESGPAPSILNGKYLLSKKAIPPSTVARLNRIEVSGQMYLYKGAHLRLVARQDSGGSLDILNTELEDRATLRFKGIA